MNVMEWAATHLARSYLFLRRNLMARPPHGARTAPPIS
ncbi:Hypothetical protein A7982_06028 [Minicystis rosea]|nr:Hypothetical protein A7982_06028 [Minicystis rosea]